MNVLNKYETVGLFGSVAIMALALAVIRFHTNVFTPQTASLVSEGAVVAVSQKNDKDLVPVENALKEASNTKGVLQKLVIDDVHIGKGDPVKKGDTVVVNYVGTTQAGVKFDSSYERGEPFEFTVGAGRVIEGWEKGLIGMKVGGQRILAIPSDMAYGNRTVGPIPANSPLVFTIELLQIK